MFDNTNPYALRTGTVEGVTRYYVSFSDGHGVHRETEVSRPVYLEFLRFVKNERNLRRWDERHLERSDLTEEILYDRALIPPKSLDEMIVDRSRNKELLLAIWRLPEIQRRRFVLHHEFGLTYGQIAKIEGCHFTSVGLAVLRAEEKIRKKLINFKNQG